MRSGSINNSLGRLGYAGNTGYVWSLTAAVLATSLAATAYRLGVIHNKVAPSGGPSNRWNGFPLRCITT